MLVPLQPARQHTQQMHSAIEHVCAFSLGAQGSVDLCAFISFCVCRIVARFLL